MHLVVLDSIGEFLPLFRLLSRRWLRFIAGAIAQLTDNNTYRQKLLHVEKLTPMRQWSARQASRLKKSDYRQSYLGERRN
ncbi:hypothetical protein LC653_34880 [Nostoc sp. CHAB 5784]|uniref:hypothetical protein n=1 Tax=Nostoc mirabile TaxID=2907820 RepID=UPI001E53A540|nr:hypothetical protein [Nostoc mirabile]MCC5668904.1 hypothetical protein [Nostoc mirabile CHAB5784]